MQNKNDKVEQFPKGFSYNLKTSKEIFHEYFNLLIKQGKEEMLQCELDEHLGYSKHAKEG